MAKFRAVALWNQKGGTGKTTLTASLGVALGERVVLIDADGQRSLSAWSELRENGPPVATGPLADVLAAARADENIDLALVDMPGTLGPAEVAALRGIDLVLVPVRPGPLDLHATLATLDVAERADRRCAIVLSQVRPRGGEADEIRDVLAPRATVFAASIGERVAHPQAIARGRTALETEPRSAAADELRALALELRRTVDAR